MRHRRIDWAAAQRSLDAAADSAGRRRYILALALALAIGFAVRGWHVLSQDFPLNDGALFYAMANDLRATHYALPSVTSYNSLGIPYGYSPLGFYLAALISDLDRVPLIDAFRWLPLVVTCLTLVAFTLLARDLLRSRTAVVAAVVAFALVPRSFIWMLMGGGVTRSLGFLFALLTLHQLYRLYTRQRWRHAVTAALWAGLTVLGHLGTGPFVAFSALLFLLAFARTRFALVSSLAAAAGAGLLSAPWWGTVIARHGLEPFLAAGSTGGWIFGRLSLHEAAATLARSGLGTGESILSVIGMLAVLGFFAGLVRGSWVVPAWWLLIIALDARQGSTFATAPIAMLAGIAVADVLLPALRRAARRREQPVVATPVIPALQSGSGAGRRNRPLARRAPELVVAALFIFSLVSSLSRDPELAGGLPELVSLSKQERYAMGWLAQETPEDSRVLVVAGTSWEVDKTSEWLPVLGRRSSVATVQGYEWMPIGAFARKKRQYIDLQGCANWVATCLEDWSRITGAGYTHVYLPKSPGRSCCRMLRYSLSHDPQYRLLYDGPGASIYAHRAYPYALDTVAPDSASSP